MRGQELLLEFQREVREAGRRLWSLTLPLHEEAMEVLRKSGVSDTRSPRPAFTLRRPAISRDC
jgi:hypothetical protein